MSNENPNKGIEQEIVVFKERLGKIKERLVELEQLTKSRGLSFRFINNVMNNVLGGVRISLEILEQEPDDTGLKTVTEEILSLAERYLDTLNKNEEALQSEASMDSETWSKMGQQESNHAREIVAKYGTSA